MISSPERRALRAKAHALKPVVLLGQHGVTPAVVTAIEEALVAHELIKVRLRGIEREVRDAVITDLAARLQAEIVNLIGHIVTLYRANPEPPTVVPVAARKKTGLRKKAPLRAAPSPYQRTDARPNGPRTPRGAPAKRQPSTSRRPK